MLVACCAALVACGDSGVIDNAKVDSGVLPDGAPQNDGSPKNDGQVADALPGADSSGGCGTCPTGYTCGSANGLAVCRAPSGVPLFSKVMIIMMENTTLASLDTEMKGTGAPNLAAMKAKYALGTDYHGVAHPSLPNYIALTSGDTQGIACDCKPEPNQGTCGGFSCSLVTGNCSCNQAVAHLGDQMETAKRSWSVYAESMGTPCNLADGNNYVVKHVPFLYYDNVRTDATRCAAHDVDLTKFDGNTAAADYSLIVPNLVHDMHGTGFLQNTTDIKNGDAWVGPEVDSIMKSTAYTSGGLLVVVWDEDDQSGGFGGSDDPIAIFVMSPYAKSGGYLSSVKADHYSLLATVEDGLGLPRIAKAAKATPLTDYFPAK